MKRGFSMALLLAAIGCAGISLAAFADGPTAAAMAGTAAPAGATAPADATPAVVAVVNGTPITREQLAALCIHFDGKDMLETLIQYELIGQEAAKQSITVSPDEIEAYITTTAQARLDAYARRNGAKDFVDWAAKANAKPEEMVRRVHDEETWLRPFALPELQMRKMLLKTIKLTEADLRAEFDRRYGPKAKVLQIVLRSDADAQDVLSKLKLGADFADMARDVSVDNVSRRKGGEIEPLGRGSPLGDAAFKLKPGQFSEPVKTLDGFHILKLVEVMPAVDKRFEDVKGQIRQDLIAQQLIELREKWIDDLFDKAAIKRNM